MMNILFTTMEANSAPPPHPQQQQPGNIGSVLTHFDRSQKFPAPQPSSLTINIPNQGDTCGDGERDRALTLGSEFDLDWALGGKDGRGISISGLLTPTGEEGGGDPTPIGAVGDGGMSSEGTSTTEFSASTTSSTHHNPTLAQHDAVATPLPQLPEENAANPKFSAAASVSNSNNNNKNNNIIREVAPAAPQLWTSMPERLRNRQRMTPSGLPKVPAGLELSGQRTGDSIGGNLNHSTAVPDKTMSSGSSWWQQQRQASPARERGDSTASQFLNGLYQQQLPLSQPQPPNRSSQSSSGMVAHTPPTHMGTSYENSHFGKRMRAGSISGRLRSASYLEDTGVISREQKAILKDLIIAGDNSVQGAIDKYEAGDASVLEDMIRSGALLARATDVDLLGDLDLDFLNVTGDGSDEDDPDGMMFGILDDIGGVGNASKSYATVGGDHDGRQMAGVSDIGDLEFNGYLSSSGMAPSRHNSTSQNSQHGKPRENSTDCLEVHRMRTNSLALPGILLDGANPDDGAQITFGRWMDKAVPLQPHAMQIMQRASPVSSAPVQQRPMAPTIVGAHRNRINLKPSQVSSECDDLMASKSRRGKANSAAKLPSSQLVHRSKVKKEKTKKSPSAKKDRKEPRERKSHSKMKDMMQSIAGGGLATAAAAIGDDNTTKDAPSSGQGRPRSMSDPNLTVHLDDHGLLHVDGPEGWVGAYSPDSRQLRISRYMEKRNHRVWVKKVKYDVRKNFADSRLRVKGRFVKKEDEMLMRELMSLT